MVDLTELLRPSLGDKADEVARSLVAHIRSGDGGVKGFFDRVKSAGFSDNLSLWLEAKPTEVSDALAANLFGAGALDHLADRFGVSIEDVTRAAGLALPHIVHLLAGEAKPASQTMIETAQNTTQKPPIVWGLVAIVLTILAIWASVGLGQAQSKNPHETAPLTQGATTTREDPVVVETSLLMEHEGVGVSYSGKVPKEHLAHYQGIIDQVLGERASGALVGIDAPEPKWGSHLEEFVKLMNNPKRILAVDVRCDASGDWAAIEGEAADLEEFRKELDAMRDRTGVSIDWSHVGYLESSRPGH